MSRYLTFVAVGDHLSNKTELLLKYTGIHDLGVKRFENNVQSIIVDRVRWMVHFVDTECDDDYEILRRRAYDEADCILLCYSVRVKSTFKNVYKKWCLEVRKCAPLVPIILIGTDIEARVDNNSSISTEQGENLKLLIGAYAFVECSIQHFLGIDDIFIEAVRSTNHRKKF
ncbi:ras-like GTP-binding protein RhoL [Tribolium madens]|uniref:ras-like GTP-binding protein RhoL n=1 Tax=Tribolium madens TaxID=41895 RepID=UPI001CF7505A|nr:ras-like GTP-binding protein RhoL [Tribolium madens]XP_044269280.1 ras-like GTP-binding protein RhoL [Tribolium madens]